jgi:DNA-binding transcriptional MerR regulator
VTENRYGIEELADLGGVNRRTVRYYVQEGLLPAPLGLGRGRHYGPQHLKSLLEVKALQERGLPLLAIREALGAAKPRRSAGAVAMEPAASGPPASATAQPTRRSSWARLELFPGVELHVSSAYRLPSPGKVDELAAWCRLQLRPEEDDDASSSGRG